MGAERDEASNLYATPPMFQPQKWSEFMLDLILVGAGTAAFVLAILYTAACEKM
jgi:hypothetical protein